METYVIFTRVLEMQRVKMSLEKNLLVKGEELYSPMIERVKRIRGIDRRLQSYMFPGYLFIETDKPDDFFLRIRNGWGKIIFETCFLLKKDAYICPISAEEQEQIRNLCGENHVLELSTGYMIGERLIIEEGPLKELQGRIVKIDRHKKLAMLRCKFMGEERLIKAGLEVVERCYS